RKNAAGWTAGGGRRRLKGVLTLRSRTGTEARLIEHGGTLMSLLTRDRRGVLENVVLGMDAPEAYQRNPHYLGALVGRCANRIRNARFPLAGREVRLDANAGQHHLHGGRPGFHAVDWRLTPLGASGAQLDY